MSSRDTKIKRKLLESGLGLLVAPHVFSGYENQTNIAHWSRVVGEVHEKKPNYGHTRMHDNMVPWALRALGTKSNIYYLVLLLS